MRIRKFNESEDKEMLSQDKIDEVVLDLGSILEEFDEREEKIKSYLNLLSSYKSKSTSSNTQIDDSYINLQSVLEKIIEIKDIMDTTINNLKDYNESGEKYIY